MILEENVASDCGGGIAIDNDTFWVTMKRIQLEDNVAPDGAAVCVSKWLDDVDEDGVPETWYSSKVRMFAVLAHENVATDEGGAFAFEAGTVVLTNVTIHENSAPRGSAIAVEGDAVVTVLNGLVSENFGGSTAVSVDPAADDDLAAGTISFSYTNFWDSGGFDIANPVGTSNNISVDPSYVDAGADDYHLDRGSDCIDAGDPSISDLDGTRSDLGWYGGPEAMP
jgi:hypothetical protein